MLESEGIEGKFYRWLPDEVREVLESTEAFDNYASIYGLSGTPNFEDKFFVPQLGDDLVNLADRHEMSVDELVNFASQANQQLLETRNRRPRPLTDTKILTSWNGLMIRGLADAGRVFDEQKYVNAAAKAADFVWEHSYRDGRLYRTYTDGQARLNGYLDDYAFLINGLIALHRADGSEKWLDRALVLQEQQNERYWDEANFGYFFTSNDHESLLARAKRATDAAIPSGNSVSVENLVYLAQHANKEAYRAMARQSARSVSGLLKKFPAASPRLMISISAIVVDDKP